MSTDSYKCSWVLPPSILDDIKNEKKKEKLSKYQSDYIHLDIPSDIENQEEYVVSKVKEALIKLGYPEKNIYIKAERMMNWDTCDIEYKITEDLEAKLNHMKNTHSVECGTLKTSTGYTTEQLLRGDHLKMKPESKNNAVLYSGDGLVDIGSTYDDIVDYGNMEPDKIELVKQIDKLKVENIDLKHAVEYYEMYVDWLESKYIFILKNPRQHKDELKDAFNRMVGKKNE